MADKGFANCPRCEIERHNVIGKAGVRNHDVPLSGTDQIQGANVASKVTFGSLPILLLVPRTRR